jgi:hypothetical protein
MLLGVVSTNGRLQTENVEAPQAFAMRRAWMPQDCASRMSHNVGETRRENVTASRPRHSSLFSRAFLQGCGRIDLTARWCKFGDVLAGSFPSNVRSDGKRIVFEQVFVSDQSISHLAASYN